MQAHSKEHKAQSDTQSDYRTVYHVTKEKRVNTQNTYTPTLLNSKDIQNGIAMCQIDIRLFEYFLV